MSGLFASRTRLLPVSLLSVVLGACAHTPPAPTRGVPAAGGQARPIEAVVDELSAAEVVCFGERHDDASDHAVEVELARLLAERNPELAIGLEMVEQPMQPVLNEWLAGSIDEATLLERLSWSTRWGFDFGLYRDLFVLARERQILLVALNARREVVRRVMQVGADVARGELGDEVPELHLEDPAYAPFVGAALEGHEGIGPEMLQRFVEAQRTWDESMARVVEHYWVHSDGHRRFLVIAGAFHCAYGLGIPSALAHRGVSPVRVVLGQGVELPEVEGRAKADFVVESPSR